MSHNVENDAPNGCGVCGNNQRSHAMRYHASVGYHTWVEPTDEQRKRRMLARRAEHVGTRVFPPAVTDGGEPA